MRRVTSGLLGAVGYGMAAVLLVVMAVVARAYQLRLDTMGTAVRHTNDVIQRLNDAASNILDLRSSERAFVTTGNAAYLAQYEQASRTAPDALEHVRALTRDNPQQQERASQVVVLADRLLGFTNEAIARARARRETDASAPPRHPRDERQRMLRDEERETMRQLLALTRAMTAEENQLLSIRRRQAHGALTKTISTVLLALGLALVLVIAATWATSANIARRKKAQREREQLQQIVELQASREENARLQERFTGVLGHDLRNPLTAIMMGTSSLLHRSLPEAETRIITRIHSSADRMRRMIEQLLDLTRVRTGGGIVVELVELDLADLARRVVAELEMAHPERALQVHARGETVGEWDPDRLAQALSNLVGNALHHGASDEPVVVRVEGAGEAVVLAVHNGGEPIPSELVPVIFDPFRRAKGGNASGLGLGLFIAQQIVLAHQGSLGVVSTAADGTTFTVTLPRHHRR
jgi:signal transduction histidine kinase